jgi:phosphonate transport system substrate-binding protein
MRLAWIVLAVLLVVLTSFAFYLMSRIDGRPAVDAVAAERDWGDAPPLRIGLIPERDVFAQRKRYRALADYLAARLERPVELVTNNTYEGVLHDFDDDEIDVAFLGSYVATLAMDRNNARVVLKPEIAGGVTTYHGVMFVRADSSIRTVDDLAGRSIGMVRTTTAGDLFPIWELTRHGLMDQPEPPIITWVGTHDAVVMEVVEGRLDAGSAKNLRIDAYEVAHPDLELRRLAESRPVPNNALLLRSAMADELADTLVEVLMQMESNPDGRQTLAEFGAVRFVPCEAGEYEAIYEMEADLARHRAGEPSID